MRFNTLVMETLLHHGEQWAHLFFIIINIYVDINFSNFVL